MAAPLRQEVDSWCSRIAGMTAAIEEILSEDPMAARQRQRNRELHRQQAQATALEARHERIRQRYDTAYYKRFERDDVIDAMLREVDNGSVRTMPACELDSVEELYSKAEKLLLEEAKRYKDKAAAAVRIGDWQTAHTFYTSALKLQPVDEDLAMVLYNNRALAQLKLHRYVEAVEDASHVLRRKATDVKALLRRASALRSLYRPLDALSDVTRVLQEDPHNVEAKALRIALQQAAEEQSKGEAFLREEEMDEAAGAGVGRGGKLLSAIQVLQNAERGDAISQLSALGTCVQVLQSSHAGAAVVFVLRGGVGATMGLAEVALAQVRTLRIPSDSPLRAGLLLALRLLGTVYSSCEVAAQATTDTAVAELVNEVLLLLSPSVVDVPSGALLCSSAKPFYERLLVNAALHFVEGAMQLFPFSTNEALQAHGHLLSVLWHNHLRPFIGPDGVAVADTVYLYTCLMSTWLQRTTPLRRMAVSRFERGALTYRLLGTTDDEEAIPLLVDVVKHTLTPKAPRSLQLAGATLALRLTSIDLPTEGGVLPSYTYLACPSFGDALQRVMCAHLDCDSNYLLWVGDGEVNACAEAMYALLYNLTVKASSRDDFGKQWAGTGSCLVPQRTWKLLLCLNPSSSIGTVTTKMIGVLAKLSSSSRDLASVMGKDEKHLWEWVEAAWQDIAQASAPTADRLGTVWHLLEHLSTLLATLHMKFKGLVQDGTFLIDHTHLLLNMVASAHTPQMDAIAQLGASAEGRVLQPPASIATPVLVTLGNTALLLSHVVPLWAGQRPSEAHSKLLAWGAIPTLLQALQMVHASASLVASEGSKVGHQGSMMILGTLNVWGGHAKAARKNLAIAVSRVSAVGEVFRQELRDLKGIDVLLAAMKE